MTRDSASRADGFVPGADSGASGPVIRVTAVLLRDASGSVLLVRKAGTAAFIFPGGKPEPGEGAAECGAREVGEELGLGIGPAELVELGQRVTRAANEADHVLVADVVAAPDPVRRDQVASRAEIAELLWWPGDLPDGTHLAPLTDEVLRDLQ